MTEVILFDSPEAAQPWTQEGWKSRDGYFYADERAARYSGCTHRPCEECGAPTPKMYVYCDSCRETRDVARYEAMPEAPWDGNQMVYSETLDRYFSDPDEAEDWLDDEGQNLASLRLVLCEPCRVGLLDIDYLCDELPEDGEAPDEVLEAMDAFNAATKDIILSWYPGKTRLQVTP
jgi:hypothetical protein